MKGKSLLEEQRIVYQWLLKTFPGKKKVSFFNYFINNAHGINWGDRITSELAQTVAFHTVVFSNDLERDTSDPAKYFKAIDDRIKFQAGYDCDEALNTEFVSDIMKVVASEDKYNADDDDMETARENALDLNKVVDKQFKKAVDSLPEDSRRFIIKDFINDHYSENYCMNSMAKLKFAENVTMNNLDNPYAVLCQASQ
mgnify:CR=1 FL=1